MQYIDELFVALCLFDCLSVYPSICPPTIYLFMHLSVCVSICRTWRLRLLFVRYRLLWSRRKRKQNHVYPAFLNVKLYCNPKTNVWLVSPRNDVKGTHRQSFCVIAWSYSAHESGLNLKGAELDDFADLWGNSHRERAVFVHPPIDNSCG